MNLRNSSRLTRPAMFLAVGVLATACDRLEGPGPADFRRSTLNVGLEVSSLDAYPGNRVAVRVIKHTTTGREIGGMQGVLKYDAGALRYVGQAQKDGTIMLVNDAPGALRFAALDVDGGALDDPTLVFEVRAFGYARSLDLDVQYATTAGKLAELRESTDLGVVFNRDLAVPAARRIGVDEWLEVAARVDDARRVASGRKASVALRPGEYRLNLQYGDANLDGAVNVTDAVYLINAAVGLAEIIAGTDAPTARDAAVAGNPFPFNTPGLGEVGDANPPGREPDGTRIVNLTDAVAVINEAVFANQDVVGELIPGRGPLAATVVPVPAGDITVNTTWTKNNVYRLDGIVNVRGGAALTIEAGTRIEGNSAINPSALFIHRDGQIFADGTALEPIVMTCTDAVKTKGCWGGLYVSGNGTVNFATLAGPSPVIPGRSAGGCVQGSGEGGAPPYGGCNPADNSGILRYVVSEYGGFLFAPANELNGITLAGVGSGTIVDFVQAREGKDDGVELFGGEVDLRHVVSTQNSDDSFDFSFGWSGKAQFVIIQHDSLDSDKGFEIDNSDTDQTITPLTQGKVYNVTLVGKPATSTGGPAGNNSEGAIHVRVGARPTLGNMLVYGWDFVLDIDNEANTCGTNPPMLVMHQSKNFDNRALANSDADLACRTYTHATLMEAEWINDAANSWATATGNPMLAPFNYQLPDFRPSPSASVTCGAPPAGFDTSATYCGAVAPADASRSNIPWYSGWTRHR